MRLIDADHVLTLEEMQKMFTGETCCMKSSIQRVLSLFPTVDAVPVVHAHWNNVVCTQTFDDSHYNLTIATCSCCGNEVTIFEESDLFGFCPHCGARMGRKEEE